jgi:hypothetical protein
VHLDVLVHLEHAEHLREAADLVGGEVERKVPAFTTPRGIGAGL